NKKSQKISKVLYRRGEKMPPEAAHAFLHSVDRLVFLAALMPKEERQAFLRRFPEADEKYSLARDKTAFAGVDAGGLRELLMDEATKVDARMQKIRSLRFPD